MKRIVVLLIGLFFYGVLNAQIPFINLNPRGGANLGKVETNFATKSKHSFGYHLGLSAEIGKKHFFEPGIHYFSYNSLQETILGNFDMKFSTIQLQLYYGFQFIDFKVGKLKAHLGPTIDMVANVADNNFGFTKSDMETAKFGLNVGVGAQLLFLTAFLDYNIPLTSSLIVSDSKHGVLSFTVGISIL